ncbi:MAG: NFACT family protein [Clostridiales bacterium]|nr:NFACT family protein [Clostridiales bacterium]
MPMDGIASHFLACELNTKLAGARIDKIYQPSRFDLYFTTRSGNENLKVLLSCNPQNPRVQITSYMRENPQMPPNFCMLLRKYLQGARILQVSCPGYERIINIDISTTDELHDTSTKRLIVEMMGRYSNIIFTNSEGKIIDALVHVDSSSNRVREVMPARIYEAPPVQGKLTADQAMEMLRQGQLPLLESALSRPASKALLDSLLGFSPLLVNDICYQCGIDTRCGINTISETQKSKLMQVLSEMLEDILSLHASPCVYYNDHEPSDWHVLKLEDAGIAKPFSSISEAIDHVTGYHERRERFESKRKSLSTIVSSAFGHVSKKLSIHEDDLHSTSDAEKRKEEGELLLAYQYMIKPEDKEVKIPDYPDFGQSITIALREDMTPSEQGQSNLKYYRKAMSRRETAERFISEEKAELMYLQSLLSEIDAASEPDDLAAIEYELSVGAISANEKKHTASTSEQKYYPGKSKSGKASSRALRQASQQAKNRQNKKKDKKAEDPSSPRKFTVHGGLEVLAGRNNIQNDHLTFGLADKDDLWFHAKNVPGTHVILKTNGGTPSDQAITEAASIAAFYSKSNKAFSSENTQNQSRYDIRVDIDYCPVSHVKKIPKAKPGMVTYEKYNTLFVSAQLPNSQEKNG